MKNTNPDKTEMMCHICNKLFNGPRALKSHTTQVHINIYRDNSKRGHPKGQPAWNKGLCKESDERVFKNAESLSLTLQKLVLEGKYKPIVQSEQNKINISERQSLKNNGGKCKWFTVDGKSVQGTYERDFAEALTKQNIIWEKIKLNNHIFKYKKDDKIKSYAPDIFLPEFNLYIEIKGFWWGDDENKMLLIKEQHFDKNLVLIYGRPKLDYIMQDIRKLLPLEPVWSW